MKSVWQVDLTLVVCSLAAILPNTPPAKDDPIHDFLFHAQAAATIEKEERVETSQK